MQYKHSCIRQVAIWISRAVISCRSESSNIKLDFGFGSQTTEFNFWFDGQTTVLNFGFGNWTRVLNLRLNSSTTVLNFGFVV